MDIGDRRLNFNFHNDNFERKLRFGFAPENFPANKLCGKTKESYSYNIDGILENSKDKVKIFIDF